MPLFSQSCVSCLEVTDIVTMWNKLETNLRLIALVGALLACQCGARLTLRLLSLLPYPDASGNPVLQPSFDEGPSLFLAAQLAVEHINNRSDILEEYRLELVQGDSGCHITAKAVTAFVEHVLSDGGDVVGVVGPACSTSANVISGLSGREEVALINVHIAASTFIDRHKNWYSFGMLDVSESFVDVLVAMVKKNKWTRIGTLYDELQSFYYSINQRFKEEISNLPEYAIHYSGALFRTHIPFGGLRKDNIRIVVVLARPNLINNLLCLAYYENFIFPTRQFIIISETEIINKLSAVEFQYEGNQYSCGIEEIWIALQEAVIINYKLSPFNVSGFTDTSISYEDFSFQYSSLINQHNALKSNQTVELTPSYRAPSYYDAVWALALALNQSEIPLREIGFNLSQYRYGHSDATDIIRERMLELEFEGVSGRIKFHNVTGHVRRTFNIYQVSNDTTNMVAHYNGSSITILSEGAFINGTVEILSRAPLSAAVLFLTLIMIALVLLTVCHMLSIIYRKERLLRASQPKLSQLAYIGCYVSLLTVVSYIIAESFSVDSSTRCALYHVLNFGSFVAVTLLLGTVCVKTWRIYRIFVSWKNPGWLISDKALIAFILVFLVIDILVNILWIAIDPFRPVVTAMTISDINKGKVLIREDCVTQNNDGDLYWVWFGLLLVIIALLVFTSLCFAILSHRHIPHQQKNFKSSNIIILTYLFCLTLAFGTAIYFTLPRSINIAPEFVVLCVTLILMVYYFLALLLIPPVFYTLRMKWTGRNIPIQH